MQGIEITLDKVRHLRFSGNSLAWLEEELRKPEEKFAEWWPGLIRKFTEESTGPDGEIRKFLVFPGANVLRYMLCACLRTEDPKVTPDWCGDWVTPERYDELVEKCVLAINAYYPKRPLSLAGDSEGGSTGASADTTSASASEKPAA